MRNELFFSISEINGFQNSNFETNAPLKQMEKYQSMGTKAISNHPRTWKWLSKLNHNGLTYMGQGSEVRMNQKGPLGQLVLKDGEIGSSSSSLKEGVSSKISTSSRTKKRLECLQERRKGSFGRGMGGRRHWRQQQGMGKIRGQICRISCTQGLNNLSLC